MTFSILATNVIIVTISTEITVTSRLHDFDFTEKITNKIC
jgi:hypothetical protein